MEDGEFHRLILSFVFEQLDYLPFPWYLHGSRLPQDYSAFCCQAWICQPEANHSPGVESMLFAQS